MTNATEVTPYGCGPELSTLGDDEPPTTLRHDPAQWDEAWEIEWGDEAVAQPSAAPHFVRVGVEEPPKAAPADKPVCVCGMRKLTEMTNTDWAQLRGKAKRCPLCGSKWLTDITTRIEDLTADDTTLYVATVSASRWPTIRKRIDRHNNGAVIANADGRKVVLTNDPTIANAHALPRTTALALFADALKATMTTPHRRVDFSGTWHPSSATEANPNASEGRQESLHASSSGKCLRSAQNDQPCSESTNETSPRSTNAPATYIDRVAQSLGGRFTPCHERRWRLIGIADHQRPEFYRRIDALTDDERTQRWAA